MSNKNQKKSLQDTAKDVIQEEIGTAAKLGQQAIQSGGYIYPFRGIVYFATHPSLYKSVLPVITNLLIVSVVVLSAMFFLLYFPHVAVLAFISGPLAFIAAIPLILAESSVIILFVARVFFVSEVQDQLFDAVLLQQGHDQLVGKGRQVLKSKDKGVDVKRLGKSITKPLDKFSTEGLIRYLITLPLNAVPVVGTIVFLLYNGIKAGPGYLSRYFGLKQFTKEQRDSFVHNNHGTLTAFGATTLALQLIPIVGLGFLFTSSVGAALYASDLERKGSGQPASAATVKKDARVEL